MAFLAAIGFGVVCTIPGLSGGRGYRESDRTVGARHEGDSPGVTRDHKRVPRRARVDPYSGVGRRLQYASFGLVLASCAAVAGVAGTGWSWWLFAWGVGAGILGMACYRLTIRFVMVALKPSPADQAKAQQLVKARSRVVYPMYLGFGLAIATVTAALQTAWPDILLTGAIVVFGLLLPLLFLRIAKRRAAGIRARQQM
ncbi:MAG TPA: hypothetical protein VNG13_01565 [Mycobacteriales bacterium]|nr:hypothetical protein [Mycobacteriales bacterium]